MPNHHNVYVVELEPAVLENQRFRDANPNHNPSKTCFYVGMTGLTPEQRFKNHKANYKANRYARDFGKQLRPDLYRLYNPMSYSEAQEREPLLAEELRAKGHAVWQH